MPSLCVREGGPSSLGGSLPLGFPTPRWTLSSPPLPCWGPLVPVDTLGCSPIALFLVFSRGTEHHPSPQMESLPGHLASMARRF